jgi:hypothetical protein
VLVTIQIAKRHSSSSSRESATAGSKVYPVHAIARDIGSHKLKVCVTRRQGKHHVIVSGFVSRTR